MSGVKDRKKIKYLWYNIIGKMDYINIFLFV